VSGMRGARPSGSSQASWSLRRGRAMARGREELPRETTAEVMDQPIARDGYLWIPFWQQIKPWVLSR
jgi:hypothetical protein